MDKESFEKLPSGREIPLISIAEAMHEEQLFKAE